MPRKGRRPLACCRMCGRDTRSRDGVCLGCRRNDHGKGQGVEFDPWGPPPPRFDPWHGELGADRDDV
jgi:hypothetical protein